MRALMVSSLWHCRVIFSCGSFVSKMNGESTDSEEIRDGFPIATDRREHDSPSASSSNCEVHRLENGCVQENLMGHVISHNEASLWFKISLGFF